MITARSRRRGGPFGVITLRALRDHAIHRPDVARFVEVFYNGEARSSCRAASKRRTRLREGEVLLVSAGRRGGTLGCRADGLVGG